MAALSAHFLFIIVSVFAAIATSQQAQEQQHQDLSQSYQRCLQTPASSKKLERVINECQDEIKLAILKEALESLQEAVPSPLKIRGRREADFSKDEKTIAGADPSGFPDPDGLVQFYTDGVEDHDYHGATRIAVHLCTRQAILQHSHIVKQEHEESLLLGRQHMKPDTSFISANHHSQKVSHEHLAGAGSLACDEAFNVFQCVTERLATFCGSNQP